jgi:hypothetical protein
MTLAGQRLRRAIIERRSDAPRRPQLAAHAAAIARHSRRGWGIDKSERSEATIALCIALDRAKQRPEAVRLVGWL